MKPVARFTEWLGLSAVLLGVSLLSACGGGSSGTSTSTPTANYVYSTSSANVAAISVNAGPGSTTACNGSCQTFNIPLVTVTVCEPANPNVCATIPNVLVDTGSSGLRLMASVLANTNSSLALQPMADPTGNGNSIYECLPFADGYSWGEVAYATVTVASETTGTTNPTGIPVQIINDNQNPSPAAPSNPSGPTCATGQSLNSVNAFDANGVLGVGLFNQDCGSTCETGSNDANSDNAVYWSCPQSGTCNSTTVAEQVSNPAASFATDNNGVIVQLQNISTAGAVSASGYLVFGIGTESNNGLEGANILTADDEGNFTTTLDNVTLGYSFIDSGSNGLYFNDSTLTTCPSPPYPSNPAFYCPSSLTSLSATNTGQNNNTSGVTFEVTDLSTVNQSYFALNDVGGQAAAIATGDGSTTTQYFDWGVPFFYGRTVFYAIENKVAGSATGPYYAY